MSGSMPEEAGRDAGAMAAAEAEDDVLRFSRLSTLWRDRVLADLSSPQRQELIARWDRWAHPGQVAPPGDWRVWLIRAGRGFGKTRAGAEWVTAMAHRHPEAHIALVGHTIDDVRKVMVEGPSGLLAVAPVDAPVRWRATMGELEFASGAKAYLYSAAAGEKLRGPEHWFAWCDEVGKWRGEAAWDNLLLGLRGGDWPRIVVTTTPRRSALMRRVMTMPGLVETLGKTRDNPHLPTSFVAAMEADYGGTRLGRQELDGELLDDHDGALWTRDGIEACRAAPVPPVVLVRVVVAVDPPAGTEHGGGDACGIVAVGLGMDGIGYVVEDASVAGASPARWAAAVAACAKRWGADRVVAEKNQGGLMVRDVLLGADAALPLRLVHAARGKSARAEPVSLLYDSGRVRHAGTFPALEDQLCGMLAAGGYAGPGRSPDRADALVWAMHELLLTRRGRASVRRI